MDGLLGRELLIFTGVCMNPPKGGEREGGKENRKNFQEDMTFHEVEAKVIRYSI